MPEALRQRAASQNANPVEPDWISLAHLRLALHLSDFAVASARQRMAPAPRGWRKRETAPKQAAVLLLLFPDAQHRLRLALTLRGSGLGKHGGQVSFPGGAKEAQDEDLRATALRETCEEIGVCADEIRLLGSLPRLYIPASHFDVSPIVAYCDRAPRFRANPGEVAEVFSFGLDDLWRSRFKGEECRRIRGRDVRVPYYAVGRHKVWGATAMLLSELEARLRAVTVGDGLRHREIHEQTL